MNKRHFLPEKGSYKGLLSYMKSVIIYDCTVIFCERFLEKRDRTVDQMIQAARSGKQNIIEGAKASVTSAETEIKLTNVARASLEELLEDYHDFLRVRNLTLWKKNSEPAVYVRKLGSGKIKLPKINGPYEPNGPNELNPAHTSHEAHEAHEANQSSPVHRVFIHFLQSRPAEISSNIMICLINQCNFLLDRQIKKLESDFIRNGGLRERMYQVRIDNRKTLYDS